MLSLGGTKASTLWYIPRTISEARCLLNVFFCRDRAFQLSDQFNVFGKPVGVKIAVIVGGNGLCNIVVLLGMCVSVTLGARLFLPVWRCCRNLHIIVFTDMMKQSRILAQKPHVVIATPGRLADHLLSTDTMYLNRIKFLVCYLHIINALHWEAFNRCLYSVFLASIVCQCMWWMTINVHHIICMAPSAPKVTMMCNVRLLYRRLPDNN